MTDPTTEDQRAPQTEDFRPIESITRRGRQIVIKRGELDPEDIRIDERLFGANGDQALQDIVDRRHAGDADMDRPSQP